MSDEIKQEEMKFCRLCGKHRRADQFVGIALCRLDSGEVGNVQGCKGCSTVVFNIRTLVGQLEQMDLARTKQAALKAEEEKKLIVIPSLRVPKNLRS